MMIKLQSILRLTCMLFTIIIVFLLISQVSLDRILVFELLIMSLCFSAIRYLFFSYDSFSSSMLSQFVYFLMVALVILVSSFIFKWDIYPAKLISNIALILPTYILTRLLNYRQTKLEADKFNRYLAKRQASNKHL